MLKGKSFLGVIVARGGSKGLPGKNLAEIGGRPLIAWSVAAAKQSQYLDRRIVSSDDDAIIAAAKAAGGEAPFRRPAQLATDDTPAAEVVIHAIDAIGEPFDYVVLLAATSPFRIGADIDACIDACAAGGPAAVSVCRTAKPPEWACRLDDGGRLVPILPGDGLRTRRQALAPAFMPNGAVYVADCDWFREHKTFYTAETVGCEMPIERSIDIDVAMDLKVARAMLAENTANIVDASRG